MTAVTIASVTPEVNWVLVFVQLPSEPSRHRVAVWRELRKGGAVPVSQGAWALPDAPAFAAPLERAEKLTLAGNGVFAVIDAAPRTEAARNLIRDAFLAARVDEWNEFQADCGKFEDEIAREIAKQKLTFGELEEEEQSLDRLRRWFRELKRRDILALPEAEQSAGRLKRCEDALTGYADLVYEAMRGRAAAGLVPTDNGPGQP